MRGVYMLNSGLDQDSWGEVALQLQWTPFARGRRTSAEYVAAQAEVRRERNERSQAQTAMLRSLFAWRRAAGVVIVPGSLSGR